jgi:type I restriction enzyme S subunit
MPSKPLSELLSDVIDNRGRTCPTSAAGIPLIATNCIRNDLLYPAYDKVRYVSQNTYKNWFRGHPEPGDLIFVLKGTPGRVCLTPDPVDFCIAQDMVALRPDPSAVYPRFLFALLRSEPVQRQIENMHVGTLIPHFKKGDFSRLLLPIPDELTQRVTGDIYFTLSDKIDLNRRMNETLTQWTQAMLFAALAGAEAVTEAPIADIAGVIDCLHSKKPPRVESGSILLQLNNIALDGSIALSPWYHISDSDYRLWTSRIELRSGDCVITNVGRVGAVAQIPERLRAAPGRNMTAIRPRSVPPTFLLESLLAPAMRSEIDRRTDSGTILDALNVRNIGKLLLRIPERAVINQFEQQARPLRALVEKNLRESKTLEELRNTLLSGLISGRIRVTEHAEAIAKEAV